MTEMPPDLGTGGTSRPVEELSYTEASRELDGIVHFFEQRDVDVDQLVGRLVRATALVEELDRRLRQTRMQVEQLVPRLAAVVADRPDHADLAPEPSAGEPPSAGGRHDASPEEEPATAFDEDTDQLDNLDPEMEELDADWAEEDALALAEDGDDSQGPDEDPEDDRSDDGSPPGLF